MRYLVITPWCPYPEHKNGGVHTVNNLLKSFPDNISIDLFYFFEEDKEAELEAKRLLNDVKFMPLLKGKTWIRRMLAMLCGIPDLVSNIKHCDLNELYHFEDYDAIIIDQIFSLGFLKFIQANTHILGLMHDNLPMFYARKANSDNSKVKRFYDSLQKRWLQKYENKFFERFEKIIYVSSLDAELARKAHKNFNTIDYINLGVNFPCDNEISKVDEKYSIVFSGVMDYEPNEDAACFLISEVYPALKEKYPSFKLCIAGKNPTDKINELAKGKDITITGFVGSMISTITKYKLYVSPLRFGSGMKNKILEAMAAGMPVLLSDVSREGINWLENDENCVFVDKGEWVDQIDRLLNDDALARRIAANGKASVASHHSWETAIEKFLVEE